MKCTLHQAGFSLLLLFSASACWSADSPGPKYVYISTADDQHDEPRDLRTIINFGESDVSPADAKTVACKSLQDSHDLLQRICQGSDCALVAVAKQRVDACQSKTRSLDCVGGYSAIAQSGSDETPESSALPFSEKFATAAAGACGKTTQQGADSAAVRACEAAVKKRGLLHKVCFTIRKPVSRSK